MPVLFKKYHAKLTFIEPLLGTVPKDRQVYATYIASHATERVAAPAEIAGPGLATDLIATVDEESATVPDERENRGWTGFHIDEKTGQAFLYDYQVKGFLKEAGNVLKDQMKVAALKSKLDSYAFVRPRRVYLADVGAPFERPLRAMTQQGPRVTVVRSDTVAAGSSIEFDILVLNHKELNEDLLRTCLDYGEFKGLGQFRNGGFGSFSYELTEVG